MQKIRIVSSRFASDRVWVWSRAVNFPGLSNLHRRHKAANFKSKHINDTSTLQPLNKSSWNFTSRHQIYRISVISVDTSLRCSDRQVTSKVSTDHDWSFPCVSRLVAFCDDDPSIMRCWLVSALFQYAVSVVYLPASAYTPYILLSRNAFLSPIRWC